jgi:hypothetical protein
MMVAGEHVAMQMPGTPVRKRSVCEADSPITMASESHAAKTRSAKTHAAEMRPAKAHAAAEMPEPATPKTPTAEVSTEARLRGVGPQAKRAETEDQETFGKAVPHGFSSTINWRFPRGDAPRRGPVLTLGQAVTAFAVVRPKSRLPLLAENGRGAACAGIGTNPLFGARSPG